MEKISIVEKNIIIDDKVLKKIEYYNKQLERNRKFQLENPDKLKESKSKYYEKIKSDPEKYKKLAEQKRESYYRIKEKKKLEKEIKDIII
jgi:hypothetical protein